MALTEAQKDAFADWMIDLLGNADNQATITAAKPGVTFDSAGMLTHLKAKETVYEGKEGILTSLETQKVAAVKAANDSLNDLYKSSSETADSIVGHVGKDHPLAVSIRNKRDSMSHDGPVIITP